MRNFAKTFMLEMLRIKWTFRFHALLGIGMKQY